MIISLLPNTVHHHFCRKTKDEQRRDERNSSFSYSTFILGSFCPIGKSCKAQRGEIGLFFFTPVDPQTTIKVHIKFDILVWYSILIQTLVSTLVQLFQGFVRLAKVAKDKGQFILKGPFGVTKSKKIQQNFCKDFCPSL